MELPLELLKRFYKIEPGNIYRGAFARDGSPHKGIVFYVTESDAYIFCITSKKGTVDYFLETDSPKAAVTLPAEVSEALFPGSRLKSYVYCGKQNCARFSLDELYTGLNGRSVTDCGKLPAEVFAEVQAAVGSSQTYSQDDLIELGLQPAS